MKVTITCQDGATAEEVYSLLVEADKGTDALSGEKKCINSFEYVPDIMQFDLNEDEIKALRKIPGVLRVHRDANKAAIRAYDVSTSPTQKFYARQEGYDERRDGSLVNRGEDLPTGVARIATRHVFSNRNRQIPHHFHYCTNYNTTYLNASETDSKVFSGRGIDCSNVDIIIIDTGVDASHPDLKGQVKSLDWSNLYTISSNFDQIVDSKVALDFYKDTHGHGTSVASLAAGRRCGWARNAHIYPIKAVEEGSQIGPIDALSLVIQFLYAKKLNKFGLSNERPTIVNNSWGYVQSTIVANKDLKDNTARQIERSLGSVAFKPNDFESRGLYPWSDATDGLIREIANLGAHVVIAGGNDSAFLESPPNHVSIECHSFIKEDNLYFGEYIGQVIPRTDANALKYIAGKKYGDLMCWGTDELSPNYSSPGWGFGNTSEKLIYTVGDVIPIGSIEGNKDKEADIAWKHVTSDESKAGIVLNSGVRYTKKEGPFFIRSSYSNYGPYVDIYAPGQDTWAASIGTGYPTEFNWTNSKTEGTYDTFNGTSAAAPIVAGIIGTVVGGNPKSQPDVATVREIIMDISSRGAIMETATNNLTINGLYVRGVNGVKSKTNLTLPYNGDPSITLPLGDLFSTDETKRTVDLYSWGEAINMNIFINTHGFNRSNNRVVQAFPVRRMSVPFIKKAADGINYLRPDDPTNRIHYNHAVLKPVVGKVPVGPMGNYVNTETRLQPPNAADVDYVQWLELIAKPGVPAYAAINTELISLPGADFALSVSPSSVAVGSKLTFTLTATKYRNLVLSVPYRLVNSSDDAGLPLGFFKVKQGVGTVIVQTKDTLKPDGGIRNPYVTRSLGLQVYDKNVTATVILPTTTPRPA